jgi:hypothetical protein
MSEWRNAAQRLDDEAREAALKDRLEYVEEPEAGIIRQILANEEPLSPKQQHVYDKYIEESLVEKCGAPGCKEFTRSGLTYCSTCEIKYGSN